MATRLKPTQKFSISRSGKQVAIPDLYNLMVLQVPQNVDIQKLCETLSTLKGIDYAEPNYIFQPDSNPPNDPLYLSKQKGFEQANDIDIDAETAWQFTTGSYDVRVGVIDTGIDYNNEDLGNGQWGSAGDKVSDGWDYEDNDPDPVDETELGGHGTPVAGIIAALRNNGKGVAGLSGGDGGSNIGSQLIALKIGTDGGFPSNIIIDAIIDASISQPTGFGCHIINLSLGSGVYEEAYRDAIRFAAANEVVVVAAKGNDLAGGTTDPHYPADYDGSWVIAVSASNEADKRLSIANYGQGIDVIAPGTTTLVHTTEIGVQNYGGFAQTSAATPHVSGLAGLIKAVDLSRPELDLHPQDIEGLIKVSAEKVGGYYYDQYGWSSYAGHGRINAGVEALKMLHAPWVLQHHTSTGGSITSSTGNYLATFMDPGGGPLPFGVYIVKRHEVTSWVDVPDYTEYHIWGRGVNETTGFSAANPNHQVGFTGVISKLTTIARLRTFVFQVWSYPSGQFLGWYPTTPSNIVYAYTTLGIPGTPPLPPPPPQNLVITNAGSSGQNPILSWNASEGADSYNVYRCMTNSQQTCQWAVIGSTSNTTFTDLAIEIRTAGQSDDTFHYYVKAENENGESSPSNEVSTLGELFFVPKQGIAQLPERFELHQNFPNPFNPTTEIKYDLPENSEVSLAIYNLVGQKIRTLVNETKNAGFYRATWNGKDDKGQNVASGIYIYRIKAVPNQPGAQPFSVERKMTLLR